MNILLKIVLKSVKSAESASKKELHYICRELSTNPPFFEKTNPIFPIFSSKTTIRRKNKPNSNPKRTQFFGLVKMNNLVNPVILSK